MTAGLAIDRRAVPVTLIRRSAGSYDADGRFVDGAETSVTIPAVIQPASGNQLKDLPEGVRTEAGWIAWSRAEIRDEDRLAHAGVIYRVLVAWPRAEGGFFRAALGRETK